MRRILRIIARLCLVQKGEDPHAQIVVLPARVAPPLPVPGR